MFAHVLASPNANRQDHFSLETPGMSQIPFAAIRTWMFEHALPFWAARGVDYVHGGFLEELTLNGAETLVAFKRTRVTCRQGYAFAHGAVLGWTPGVALAERACAYLEDHARLEGGGWARLLTREGAVSDAAPDLYDLSFVLFALAWRYRAEPDERSRGRANQVLDFIQANLQAPGGGYWPKLPHAGVRLQNPHMHLTEACIAAYDAFGEQRFLDQARELIGLLRTRFFDGRTLGERFGEDWSRLAGDEGSALEPGHHFEWTWILAQYQRLTGENVTREAQALTAFAEAQGVDARSGAVYDSVRDDGVVLKSSSRSWTNTERIKAHLALFELTGADPRKAVAQSVQLLFDRYLDVPTRGAWIDQFDGEGRPLAEVVPASILYHLFLAFAEVLRLEPKLKALD
jgi:mannose/cellobiose epimerase-like protein (N-acyl-D-glucosamine 2-epimerase family)